MAAPAVQQHQRVIRAQAAQGERPDDVVRIRDALAREVHRGSELLENLARLGGPLLLDLLGCEYVHWDGELVSGCVPRPRADHDVHRREPDRLRMQREVLAGGLRLAHRDAHDLRHVAEQPRAHRVGAGRHAPDLVVPLLVRGGARADRLDADAHPRQRRPGGVGHAAAHRPALSGEPPRSRDQHQDDAGDDTDEASHRFSFMFPGVTAVTNPHAARYTAGSGGRQGRWDGAKKPPSGAGDARRLGRAAVHYGRQLLARPRAVHSSIGTGIAP